MIEFTSLDSFSIRGRGRCFTVTLDQDTDDFAHIMGKEVLLDGQRFRVKGVDRRLHSPPWRKGEMIGLVGDSLENKT